VQRYFLPLIAETVFLREGYIENTAAAGRQQREMNLENTRQLGCALSNYRDRDIAAACLAVY
jgi:hypothetical protein